MRKLFALLFVAAAFTFASCEKKSNEQAGADTTAAPAADTATAPATDMTPQQPADTAAATTTDTAATTTAPATEEHSAH